MTQEAGVPPDFWGRIQKMIDDSVAKLARSGMLRNASISGGELTIKGGKLRVLYPLDMGGGTGVLFGDLYNEDDLTEYIGTGLLVQGPDGNDIAQFRSDVSGGGNLAALRDAVGNVMLTTFGASEGFNRPFFTGGFTPARFSDFAVSTTSSTFETVWRAYCYRQNPDMLVRTLASMDTSGTTGELRILVDGVQLGSTAAVGFAVGTYDFGAAPVGTGHLDFLTVEIQARRTSASGSMRVAPGTWIGLVG